MANGNTDGGFSGDDLAAAMMAGNEIFLQWYYATHPEAAQTQPALVQPLPGGGRLNVNQGTIILLVVGVAAIVLLSR